MVYEFLQVVDFMSTDADRIVNFCSSFHQFWSLPFQIAVSLYLLYLQVLDMLLLCFVACCEHRYACHCFKFCYLNLLAKI